MKDFFLFQVLEPQVYETMMNLQQTYSTYVIYQLQYSRENINKQAKKQQHPPARFNCTVFVCLKKTITCYCHVEFTGKEGHLKVKTAKKCEG